MVSSAIWIKHARVSFSKSIKKHESEGRVLFESLKNSRALVLFKFHEKPSYYVLIIYIKDVRDNCSFNLIRL